MTNQELEIWLSIPEVAELLDVRLRDVRALVASNELLAVRRGESNALAIHRDQLVIEDGQWCPLVSTRHHYRSEGRRFERRRCAVLASGHQRRVGRDSVAGTACRTCPRRAPCVPNVGALRHLVML